MPNLGFPELILILLIVIVIFGASRLPRLGRGLGEGIRNFKESLGGDQDKTKPDDDADGPTTPR